MADETGGGKMAEETGGGKMAEETGGQIDQFDILKFNLKQLGRP